MGSMIEVDGGNPLFATRRVALDFKSPPLVVVGLPRSGTSFLSHVLTAIQDWYIFDDLYFRRKVVSMGAYGPFKASQLEELVRFLTWQVRARLKWDSDFPKPECTLEDMDNMERILVETFRDSTITWSELLEEFLVRLALLHGKTHWGYKAPGDFLHLEELMALFPGTRLIFCLRDPRAVMASFKFLSGEDGTRKQYHPVAYARYWALAEQTLEATQRNGLAVELALFEDFVAHPAAVGRRLAEFLESDLVEKYLPKGANTSFSRGKRKTITQTEEWICEKLCGPGMSRLGYEIHGSTPRLKDVLDLLQITMRFIAYQVVRAIRDRGMRASVFDFARRAIRSEK